MSFAALPAELRLRIIKESIQAQLHSSSSALTTQTVALQVEQAITLAQVSRICHAIVVEMLYHTIRITHPSSLLELRATLENTPRLASLIVNLHIGATSELAQRGWPIVEGRGSPSRIGCPIQTTLSEAECPSWCKAGATFNIKLPEIRARTIAVDDALQDAMRDIDVEPLRRGWTHSDKHIGMRKWAERLFLLQAALDLYLVEMKRLEEAVDRATLLQDHQDSDSSLSLDVEYPRLKILFHPSPRKASTDETGDGGLLTVTSQQLWERVIKRGSPADHFDHLVRLTRSTSQGLGMTNQDEWGRVRWDLSGPHLIRYSNSEWQMTQGGQNNDGSRPEGYEEPDSDDEGFLSDGESSSGSRHPLDGQRVEDLLDAARYTLCLTSNLKSLSLTSYFDRALPSLCGPEALRSLVIGPRACYWDDVLPSSERFGAFKNVKRLRVVGRITQDDAAKIATMLPRLQKVEVEWEMTYASTSSHIHDIIDLLQGHEDGEHTARGCVKGNAAAVVEEQKTGPLPPHAASTSDLQPTSSSLTRHTLVFLNPHVVPRVLAHAAASSTDKKEAWERGSSLPHAGGSIVKVASSEAIRALGPGSDPFQTSDVAALYRRGREGWEEGARTN